MSLWLSGRNEAMFRKEKVTEQATEQVTEQVVRVILIMENKPIRLEDLLEKLGLKHRPTFYYTYIKPATENGFIEMTLPSTPTSPNQRYRLTEKGRLLKDWLKKTKK